MCAARKISGLSNYSAYDLFLLYGFIHPGVSGSCNREGHGQQKLKY
jgi:hypothetical protein